MRGFSQLRFSAYARDLEQAILGLSRERMGISNIKQELAHVPDISQLTMRHGDNGRTEIYELGDVEVELPAGAKAGQIADALANPFQFSKKN